MKQFDKETIIRWLCYGAAALVGICLGLAALWAAAPRLDQPEPPVTEPAETTAPTIPTTVPETTVPEETEPLWNLLLVNGDNPLPEDFAVILGELETEHTLDERICDQAEKMLADMRAEGLRPMICSSYRTEEKQQSLFRNKVNQYLKKGLSQEEAETQAKVWVAAPGTSEHQTGLAADIIDTSYPYLDEKQEKTAAQQWLMAHAWEYGFILRYPSDKTEITGIGYEPWHYRYVGEEVAKEIFDQGICLEEYLESIEK